MNRPELEGAVLLYNVAGSQIPFAYTGTKDEIDGYRTSAWIGTPLAWSPTFDVYGPDAAKFLNSICTNDFSKLSMKGLRHAVICNEKGQILTDGVVIRIGEDRYRTYWLDPPLEYLLSKTEYDVKGENITGQEYFIQIQGEKSLQILEDAFQKDLHDIKFPTHRKEMMGDYEVEVIRMGMSGNLAYEIHGPIADFEYVYTRVWASGQKFGAKKLGMGTYSLFNHTEGGFPNILLHYPMPIFESGDEMADYYRQRPQACWQQIARKLGGSVGDDLESRFVTPFDVGWDFLVKFNHEFTGRAALEAMTEDEKKTAVTLEWNAEDVAKVFATTIDPTQEPCEQINTDCELDYIFTGATGMYTFRADKVFADGKWIGISAGRIISYHYNSMISLGFIDRKYAVEGTELTLLWGTPGTRQMEMRVKVARYPYNQDYISNSKRDVSDIPTFEKA